MGFLLKDNNWNEKDHNWNERQTRQQLTLEPELGQLELWQLNLKQKQLVDQRLL